MFVIYFCHFFLILSFFDNFFFSFFFSAAVSNHFYIRYGYYTSKQRTCQGGYGYLCKNTLIFQSFVVFIYIYKKIMRIICKKTYWFKILFIGYMAYKNDQYIKFSDIIKFSGIFFVFIELLVVNIC